MTKPPIFVLSPGRSFSSVVSTMLGEHPELYGFPELNLFCAEDVRGVFLLARERVHKRHGLLRAIAEIEFGEQTEESVREAFRWLRARARWSSERLEQYLIDKLAPRRCVDKSPFYWEVPLLRRTWQAFPGAHYLHVGRHPRGIGSSLSKVQDLRQERGQADREDLGPRSELYWRKTHESILIFRDEIPAANSMFVEGERLLSDPEPTLKAIAGWLGIDAGAAAIEAMKHPETSPYARPGPPLAARGNNPGFLQSPVLRRTDYPDWRLDGPVEWLPGSAGFAEETKRVAQRLGYA